jgi:hypothetical protein
MRRKLLTPYHSEYRPLRRFGVAGGYVLFEDARGDVGYFRHGSVPCRK